MSLVEKLDESVRNSILEQAAEHRKNGNEELARKCEKALKDKTIMPSFVGKLLVLDETIDTLFNEFGAQLIIDRLAKRIGEESAIARGEVREIEARKWTALSRELLDIANDLEGDFFGA